MSALSDVEPDAELLGSEEREESQRELEARTLLRYSLGLTGHHLSRAQIVALVKADVPADCAASVDAEAASSPPRAAKKMKAKLESVTDSKGEEVRVWRSPTYEGFALTADGVPFCMTTKKALAVRGDLDKGATVALKTHDGRPLNLALDVFAHDCKGAAAEA
jgi:hypothetical protein